MKVDKSYLKLNCKAIELKTELPKILEHKISNYKILPLP